MKFYLPLSIRLQIEQKNILPSYGRYFFKGEVLFDIKIITDRKKQIIGKVRLLNWMILVNNQLDAQFFFMYVYFYSVNISGSHVPIIRRINCINTTPGLCHCVDDLVCTCIPCIPDGHLHSDINQVSNWYNSFHDDGHMAARNI